MDLRRLSTPGLDHRGGRSCRDPSAAADVVLGRTTWSRRLRPGISAKQLRRQLGLGRLETAWAMRHKLRAAMVAREREPLKDEVEIDEFFHGGHEEGLKGGRQHGKKVLRGAAIELRGRGSGRLRLQMLPTSRAETLEAFTHPTKRGAQAWLDDLVASVRRAVAAGDGADRRGASPMPRPSRCAEASTSSSRQLRSATRLPRGDAPGGCAGDRARRRWRWRQRGLTRAAASMARINSLVRVALRR